jgi:hypothetical protein
MAAAGASAGSVVPGWGTAIGAVAGFGAALIGGGSRRRRQNSEITTAKKALAQGQVAYNTASQERDMNNISQFEYYKRANPYRRMQNLYA